MDKKFPDGFLWGAATASFQVEGGIENNDWAEAARSGKVPFAGLACDSYRRYEEDFDIAKSLNHNAHRFSIEWSRIEPEEGKFDEKEIEHYRTVIRAMKVRGLEPFVTLWHFTLPLWLARKGGITSSEFPKFFERYVRMVVEKLGSEATFWITINEPMVVTGIGMLAGMWPPFTKNPIRYLNAVENTIRAHCRAYLAIKEIAPTAQVGVANNHCSFESRGPIGAVVAAVARWWYNEHFLNATRGTHDFIGLNHYFRIVFWMDKKEKEQYPKSDFGWELYPPAIYDCLMQLKKYKLPIYITENGLADAADTRREKFIRESLVEVHRAIQGGADVRGYMHWSLLDNYEWAEGFKMRFGLVAVDFDHDRTRTVRESAKVYATICKENAI